MPLLILVLSTLACGSFAPRPTPPPPAAQQTNPAPIIETEAPPTPRATATLELATSVPTRVVPTPTFTPTPPPGTALMPDQPARVVAPQGLNVRDEAGVSGERLGRIAPGARVEVVDGPVEADGYRWWWVRYEALAGWVADGDEDTEWLSPQLGDPRPVDRSVRLGDEVLVTVKPKVFLKVRTKPGLNSLTEFKVPPDTKLTIAEGPKDVDSYRWWRVTNESGSIDGWAAEGSTTERWLTPLE